MRHTEDSQGFTWVDGRTTEEEVRKDTGAKFSAYCNEQLKALMLQVKALSEHAGVELVPSFVEQLKLREEIMADHRDRKAKALED